MSDDLVAITDELAKMKKLALLHFADLPAFNDDVSFSKDLIYRLKILRMKILKQVMKEFANNESVVVFPMPVFMFVIGEETPIAVVKVSRLPVFFTESVTDEEIVDSCCSELINIIDEKLEMQCHVALYNPLMFAAVFPTDEPTLQKYTVVSRIAYYKGAEK